MSDSTDRDQSEGAAEAADGAGPDPAPDRRSRLKPRRKRSWGGRLALLTVEVFAGVLTLTMISLVAAALLLSGETITLPDWTRERIETALNRTAAPANLTIGEAGIAFIHKEFPRVTLQRVALADGKGQVIAELPDVQVDLDLSALLERRLSLRWVALRGADLSLRRDRSGRFDVVLGDQAAPAGTNTTLADILNRVDSIFERPVFEGLEGVSVEALRLTYTDTRAGRRWEVRDGLMAIGRTPQALSAQLFFSLQDELGLPSEVAMTVVKPIGVEAARLSVNFSDLPARDIAVQSPALAPLSVIDAPISGAVSTGLAPGGAIMPLSAALEVGQGALNPVAGAEPILFESGKSYLSYTPSEGRVALNSLELNTEALSLKAEGQTFLRDIVDGWPTSFVTQIQLSEMVVDPSGILAEPARFTAGAIETKLTLDPFVATIGQALLVDLDGAAYRADGRIEADRNGWTVALDMAVDRVTKARLMALWPPELVPRTRTWVNNNILGGDFTDLNGALRLSSDGDPRLLITHDFSGGKVRFLNTFPPVEQGVGYLSISETALNVVIDEGVVTAPQGGLVDVGGTVFHVPDINKKPADAELRLNARGTVEAALSLLDLEPLGVMRRSRLPVDLAEGRADVQADIRLVLAPDQKPQDAMFSATAQIFDVSTDKLVAGRELAADLLQVSVDREQVSISGSATLDGVPVTGVWTQRLGPEAQGRSTVEGSVELSQRAVDAFDIGLPDGTVSGTGLGDIRLEISRDAPPAFTLSSDLNRVGLRLPAIGWSKPAARTGSLTVTGVLGAQPSIDQLTLDAPGLSATGTVEVTAEGALAAARFSDVRVGGWLRAPVVLRGRGAGASPAVQISGGRLDLRNLPGFSGGGGGGGTPITLALDELVVSEGIRLAGVRGDLTTRGGLQGTITGTVVGGAPIRATLAPTQRGTAVRVTSSDAGRVLRGAGIFENSRGGDMNLVLAPRGPAGDYDGKLTITNTRVRDAPALAGLLSAVSVVGLLEQMDGAGLFFGQIDGDFRLTPTAVQITRGSAVGPSLGISLAGVYDLRNNRLNMQGVISPVYMLNGIGSVLTRRGEGLFGFNYSLRGDAKNPQIGVNPLSILTPGLFREIFRTAPPELGN